MQSTVERKPRSSDVINLPNKARIKLYVFVTVARSNEKTSQNPRRVAHCRVSSLVMVCRRSFAAKANLLAIETALLTRRQQSADHKHEVCQVGKAVNTEYSRQPLLLAFS